MLQFYNKRNMWNLGRPNAMDIETNIRQQLRNYNNLHRVAKI